MRVHRRHADRRRYRGARAFLFLTAVVVAVAAAPAYAADEVSEAPPAPALTLTASPGLITAGKTTTLTAQIGVPGAVLVVARGTAAAPTYELLRTVVTDATGTATWTVSPRRISVYRVEYAGDAAWGAAVAETTVSVRPRFTLTATTPVYQGMKVVLRGARAARSSRSHRRGAASGRRGLDPLADGDARRRIAGASSAG